MAAPQAPGPLRRVTLRRDMTFVITENCVDRQEQNCVEVCPVDCIYEAGRLFVIHPVECIDCGACVPECPVEAIVAARDVPPAARPFVAINAATMDGPAAVDAALAAHFALQ